MTNPAKNQIQLPEACLAWTRQIHAQLLDADFDSCTALRAEASHRRFFRCKAQTAQNGSISSVLMISPPQLERNGQFEALANLFKQQGLGVPEIFAHEVNNGWMLMQDLGSRELEACYATAERDAAIGCALDQLPKLFAISDPLIAPYDAQRLHTELNIFTEWLLPSCPQAYQGVVQCADVLVDSIMLQPVGCVHRDYHCRNLMFENEAIGIVDFQDALAGPLFYDVASLLHDCYYEFEPSQVQRWLSYFIEHHPAASRYQGSVEAAERTFDFTAVQRQIKALGIFARLYLRDHKTSHLVHIQPLLERLLRLTGNYPELAALTAQLETCSSVISPVTDLSELLNSSFVSSGS